MIYLIIFIILLLVSFLIYWYIKFKYLLYIEQKNYQIEKRYSGFEEFVYSLLSVLSNFHMESYLNLINMIFVKLNSFFPDTSIYFFEKNDGEWEYIGGVNNIELDLNFSKVEEVINTAKDEVLFIEESDVVENKSRKFIILPFNFVNKKVVSLIVFDDHDKEMLIHYCRFLLSFFNFIKNYYEAFSNVISENKKIKMEIDALVKEIEAQNSRLIKKSKENRIIEKEILNYNFNNEDQVMRIISSLYSFINPSFIIYFSYKEESDSLTPLYFLPQDKSFSKYTINVSENSSLIVKSFISKSIIIFDGNKEQGDKDLFFEDNAIKSAVIVPIYSMDLRWGVLIIASIEERNFSEELSLIELAAKEISIMIEMINLYNRLNSYTKTLAETNKLKDQFISTVNHEIRTPLTTIKGFLSVILSEEAGSLNEQQKAFLNIVEQSANRLISITSSLLDISKLNSMDQIDPVRTDMVKLIEDTIEIMKLKAYPKGIKIFLEKDLNEAFVMIDRHLINQVIVNLIDNAIKYSPKDSDVVVKIYDKGSFIVVMVKDSGYGIDDVDKKYVFEKFYRSKDIMLNTQGSGLGLSIAKSIIEKHNGKIWFESEKGKGSKFYFALEKSKE